MPLDKLYVRIKCTMCSGGGHFSAGGYYNSMEPGRWAACPYCDSQGTVYVEAASTVVAEYLSDLPLDKYEQILQKTADKKSDSQ